MCQQLFVKRLNCFKELPVSQARIRPGSRRQVRGWTIESGKKQLRIAQELPLVVLVSHGVTLDSDAPRDGRHGDATASYERRQRCLP